jgi:hypothetical protein
LCHHALTLRTITTAHIKQGNRSLWKCERRSKFEPKRRIWRKLRSDRYYPTHRLLFIREATFTSLFIATVASLLLQQGKVPIKIELSLGYVLKLILKPFRRYTRPTLNCIGLHHREGGPSVEQRPSCPKKPFLDAGQNMFGREPTTIPFSTEALKANLLRLENEWDTVQASRCRDAVYGYLTAVFDLVTWWAKEGRAVKRACRALHLRGYSSLRSPEPFASIVRCTSDPDKVDDRTRSKWSRVLRYAAEYKGLDEPLADFIKRKGGINKCAARFARRLGRRSAVTAAKGRARIEQLRQQRERAGLSSSCRHWLSVSTQLF